MKYAILVALFVLTAYPWNAQERTKDLAKRCSESEGQLSITYGHQILGGEHITVTCTSPFGYKPKI